MKKETVDKLHREICNWATKKANGNTAEYVKWYARAIGFLLCYSCGNPTAIKLLNK